jgi:hypothetical protein
VTVNGSITLHEAGQMDHQPRAARAPVAAEAPQAPQAPRP